MSSDIHPTAIIASNTKIGSNVTIEPYVIIKGHVTIGNNVKIKSHAYIDGNTTIGEGTVIYPAVSIGTKTQAKKYYGEMTYVKIGKYCEIREGVTITSSFDEGSIVSIGNHCLIMSYCQISHHCKVNDHVIMGPSVMLAGHVEIESFANVGGITGVHQFTRIGKYAMIGGCSRINKDVPPYTLGAGASYRLCGLNLVGLKRHKFSLEIRKNLTKAFKFTYRSHYPLKEALQRIKNEINPSKEIQHWIDFCSRSKRGLIGFPNHIKLDELPQYQDLFEE